VEPNTDAPGSCAGLMPDGTFVGAFGDGVEAEAGPASAAKGATIAATPSKAPTDSRVFLMRIMSLCTVL
jgi:hypothetical protein